MSATDTLGYWDIHYTWLVCLRSLSETVDFVFEDSSHANPQLRDNLNFWLTHLKSGGIIAGHDYTNMWPDVVTEVDALSKLLNVDLHVQGSIWWMVKP